VPVFIAPPNPSKKVGFDLPGKWEQTKPDVSVVDRWKPGWAICAVGGVVADFVDVDPRNGGNDPAKLMMADGNWPHSYGRAVTPSGGTHDIISPLGIGKDARDGIDYQGGAPDGSGRGFVFIAPTVRPSKVTGEPVAYRWTREPDFGDMAAFKADNSGHYFAGWVTTKASANGHQVNGESFTDPGGGVEWFELPEVIKEGERDDFLFKLASSMRAQSINYAMGKVMMETAWKRCEQPPIAKTKFSWDEALAKLDGAYDRYPGGRSEGYEKSGENGQANTTDQTEIDRRYLELVGQLLDVDGLRNITPPQPLVEGYLFKDTLAWFSGSPGHGKSFGAVDIACCVTTGTAWHGHQVEQGPVLYLIAEGASGLSQRVDAWETANQCKVTGVTFLPIPVQIGKPNTVDVAAFTLLLQDIKPVLVIIDTQARVTVGSEENSNTDMGKFVEVLETLRRSCEACMLTVHHTPRNGDNLRGAVALEGAATSIVHFAKDGDDIELTNQKQKDAPIQEPMHLTLYTTGKSAALFSDLPTNRLKVGTNEQRILHVLANYRERWCSATELKEAADIASSSFHRARENLLNKKRILLKVEGRSKFYRLPDQDIPDLPAAGDDDA
jgi:hypothetical protein